jgi:hypothetical protein
MTAVDVSHPFSWERWRQERRLTTTRLCPSSAWSGYSSPPEKCNLSQRNPGNEFSIPKPKVTFGIIKSPAHRRGSPQNSFTSLQKKTIWYPVSLPSPPLNCLQAAIQIERIVRGFVGRCRVRRIAQTKFSKFYDSKKDKFYYFNHGTSQTSWTASTWLLRQNLPLSPEDQALYESMQRIKELEAKLREKDQEIKDVRQKRFEELEVPPSPPPSSRSSAAWSRWRL